MSDKGLQEMVGDLLEFFNGTNVCPHDRLLLLVDSYWSENLHIHILLIFKVPEGSRQLILVLLVENDLASTCVIVNVKDDPHLLIVLLDDACNYDDLKISVGINRSYFTNLLTVDFQIILRSYRSLSDHFESHGVENLIFTLLLLLATLVVSTIGVVVVLISSSVLIAWGSKEPWIVVCELHSLRGLKSKSSSSSYHFQLDSKEKAVN